MNRRELLIKTPLVLAGTSALSFNDLDLFAQSAPPLRAPINQALLTSLQNGMGPVIGRLVAHTATTADVRAVQNQIASLRAELVRIGFEAPFKFACTRFSGSDPRFSAGAISTQVAMVVEQWAPSVTYAQVHSIYLRMPMYNTALPPFKLAGIMQGNINQLAIQGMDQFLLEVESTLSEIGQLIYGNFWTTTTCTEILRALAFLSIALNIISGICLLTGVLVEICPIGRIISFVIGIIVGFIRAFFCGF